MTLLYIIYCIYIILQHCLSPPTLLRLLLYYTILLPQLPHYRQQTFNSRYQLLKRIAQSYLMLTHSIMLSKNLLRLMILLGQHHQLHLNLIPQVPIVQLPLLFLHFALILCPTPARNISPHPHIYPFIISYYHIHNPIRITIECPPPCK